MNAQPFLAPSRNPFLHPPVVGPLVRVVLPLGMGTTFSARGVAYECDEDRSVLVPEDVAVEIRSHFPPTPAAALQQSDAPALRAEIRAIDLEVVEKRAALSTLEQAAKRAQELAAGSGAADDTQELQEARQRTVTDWILGLASRKAVDEVEAKRAAAAARAVKDQRAREVAALGQAGVRARMVPLEQEIQRLGQRRSLAVRRLIRLGAEQAAVEMRRQINAMGRCYAVVNAHALLLEELERGIADGDERLSFGSLVGNAVAHELPAWSPLRAFADCPANKLSIAFDRRSTNGATDVIPFDEIRATVRQGFVDKGLLP